MELGYQVSGRGRQKRHVGGMSVDRENVPAVAGRETLLVMIEDSLALSSKLDAAALFASTRSVQVTGDVECQRSTCGRGFRQGEKGRGEVDAGLGIGRQSHATVTADVCAAALDQVESDILVKVEKMVETLRTENVSPLGESVAGGRRMLVR